MADEVAIVAVGHSSYGKSPKSIKGIFAEAFQEMVDGLEEAWDPEIVEEAYVGSLSFGGAQIGNPAALLLEQVGLVGVAARRVENACASGGFALRDAYHAILSGRRKAVLVGGIEKMNDLSSRHKRFWLGVSGDTEWERMAGLTFPGVYALMAKRHMHEHGTTKEQLAQVAVKNHRNGMHNPKAQFRKEVDLQKVLDAAPVCSPLGLYDCCATTDGAACLLLVHESIAEDLTDEPVWVRGSGAATDHLALHDRSSLTRLEATVAAAREAFDAAGMGPRDMQLAEVHDCFTIAELLAVEDLGFADKGNGGRFIEQGLGDINGEVAVNASGGLKAKGHPLGATGVGQAVEAVKQLTRRAEPGRAVRNATNALIHNVGGSGATCAVHVLSTLKEGTR